MIFVTKLENVEDANQKITHEIRQISSEMLFNGEDEFYVRLGVLYKEILNISSIFSNKTFSLKNLVFNSFWFISGSKS